MHNSNASNELCTYGIHNCTAHVDALGYVDEVKMRCGLDGTGM